MSQPASCRAASRSEPREEGLVLRHAAPRCAVFGNDQRRNDDPRAPAKLRCDFAREPHFRVERPEQALNIGDDGLDLDDHQESAVRVDGQQVSCRAPRIG